MKRFILASMVVFACFGIGMAQSGKKATAQEKKDLFQLISKDNLLIEMLNDTGEKVDGKTAQSMAVKKIDLNKDASRNIWLN